MSATDYTEMDGPTMLASLKDDASKWAIAFNQHAIKLGHAGMDEEWLIGWFANAIETADAHRHPASPPLDLTGERG